MRGVDDMVRMLRNVLTAIDELKTAQPVGTNQIVAKPFAKPGAYDLQFTPTVPFQSAGSTFKVMRINVIPQNMPAGNILISDVVADLRKLNGDRVSQWNFSTNQFDYSLRYFVEKVNPANAEQNTYVIGVIAPTNTTMRLKLHVVANADVTFTIEELN